MKYLIYCTKANPYLCSNSFRYYVVDKKTYKSYMGNYNGKIVAEFECDKVEEIKYKSGIPFPYLDFESELSKTCLIDEELEDYLFPNNGYAIHIKNLKVFDEPLKLSECDKNITNVFINDKLVMKQNIQVDKAPQNMCYVWYKGEKYCLISIRPEWVCKILNGEKTIEVRKKVLKGML